MRHLILAVVVLGALAAVPTAGATNECRGLNPCVPIAGPWVVVPTGRTVPRPQVQYQLSCPRGWVVAGLDAELTDAAIDIAFLGLSGAPVGPGVSTSRTVVFVGRYTGTKTPTPTFRPHAGCVPAAGGGGQRTPTGVRQVVPPGQPAVRRVKTQRVISSLEINVACKPEEQLVDWHVARGFATVKPPTATRISGLEVRSRAAGRKVTVNARATEGAGLVQVSAVCAGGK